MLQQEHDHVMAQAAKERDALQDHVHRLQDDASQYQRQADAVRAELSDEKRRHESTQSQLRAVVQELAMLRDTMTAKDQELQTSHNRQRQAEADNQALRNQSVAQAASLAAELRNKDLEINSLNNQLGHLVRGKKACCCCCCFF
jgi:chromosome segregation ATPase